MLRTFARQTNVGVAARGVQVRMLGGKGDGKKPKAPKEEKKPEAVKAADAKKSPSADKKAAAAPPKKA